LVLKEPTVRGGKDGGVVDSDSAGQLQRYGLRGMAAGRSDLGNARLDLSAVRVGQGCQRVFAATDQLSDPVDLLVGGHGAAECPGFDLIAGGIEALLRDK
jgi:hypothetical protein